MIRRNRFTQAERKLCRKVFWRTMSLSASYNYETMQALGFVVTMIPVVNQANSTPQQQIAALKRHNELFNTTVTMAGMITGIVTAMELEASYNPQFDRSTIHTMKTSLMGPFAAIGDSLFWGTFRVISLGIGLSLALSGQFIGVILHLLIYNIPSYIIRYYGVFKGFELKEKLLLDLAKSDLFNYVLRFSGMIGMMMLGAMATTMIKLPSQSTWITTSLPNFLQDIVHLGYVFVLPVGLVLISTALLKKGVSPAKLMFLLFIISVVGKTIGII